MSYILTSLFSILMGAALLTIFELTFFEFVVAPTIKKKMDGIIKKLSLRLGNNVEGIFQIPPRTIKAIADEEAILVKEFNRSVIYDGYWILGLLVIAILTIGLVLSENNDFSINLIKTTIGFSLGTAILFGLLQLYFFLGVSMTYHYPSDNETQLIAIKAMIKTLKSNLGQPVS